MPIEWARLRPQPAIELDSGIVLRGEGRCTALLLHGLTGSPTELAYVAHALRSRGRFHVRCPRLANHGQPVSILARTTWQEIYDSAVRAFIDARNAARADGTPLVVGGLSLGADLSLMLAAQFPEDVAGVACLAPTLFYDGWSVPWYHRLLPLAQFTPLKRFAFLRESEPFGLRDEALRAKVAARFAGMTLEESSQAYLLGYAHFPVSLFCEMRHIIERCKRDLPKVRCPLLVVQAQDDDATSPRNGRYVMEHVGSARRELLLLRNSYHLVSADLERSVVAERLQRFCASLASPAREAAREERPNAEVAT